MTTIIRHTNQYNFSKEENKLLCQEDELLGGFIRYCYMGHVITYSECVIRRKKGKTYYDCLECAKKRYKKGAIW